MTPYFLLISLPFLFVFRSVTLSPRHAVILHDLGDDAFYEGQAHDGQTVRHRDMHTAPGDKTHIVESDVNIYGDRPLPEVS